jgi:hypothetical protein
VSGDEVTGSLPGMESDADARAERAAREDFPTPRSLVQAALEMAVPLRAVRTWTGYSETRLYSAAAKSCTPRLLDADHPLRVLDVCAGSGCWASEMRRLALSQGWPVHITGVEIDERKREHLAKWCDEAYIDDWLDQVCEPLQGESNEWDLAIGNPHFTALAHEDPEQSMPAVLLRHAPAVLLLHTQQAFIRGRHGRAVLRAYPRAAVWDIPGSVSFTPDGKGDARCYQVSLWLRDHDGPATLGLLPEPPGSGTCWRYSVTPGTEEPSADLPAAPGWSP